MEDLTDRGIKTAYQSPAAIRADYNAEHGDPVFEDSDVVIYRDDHNVELSEWANDLGVSRAELSEQMHSIARAKYTVDSPGDPWSAADPVVFDKETFAQ